jgi:hypothetical protein
MVDRATGEAFCYRDRGYFGLHPSNRPHRAIVEPPVQSRSGLVWSAVSDRYKGYKLKIVSLKGIRLNAPILIRFLRPHPLQRKMESLNTMENKVEKTREVLALLRKCSYYGYCIYEDNFKEALSKAPSNRGYKYIELFIAVDFQNNYDTFDKKMLSRDYSDIHDMHEAYVTNAVAMGLLVQFLAKDGNVVLTV